ncbi:MAG: T9SS type A sorting domain-containing protein [Bacteroidia bacterium]|nr:T9SS type A sorting domain-containing protein [Bacteroidia bacterium]
MCYKQNSVLTYKNPACLTCFDIICTDVGINESYEDHGLTVYPNPTNDIFNIQTKNLSIFKNALVKITDLSGRILLEKQIIKQINIKDLKPGIYFIQLYSREKLIAIEKIIKE